MTSSLLPMVPASRGGKNGAPLLLALLVGLGILALALVLLSPLAPAPPDLQQVNRVLMVDQASLKPEPLERFLYTAGVLLLPFCLGIGYLGVRRIGRLPAGRRVIERLETPVAWALAPLLLLLLFSAGGADDRAIVRSLVPGGAVSLAAAVAVALLFTAAADSRFREPARRITRFLLPALAGLLFLGMLLFNILGPEHISKLPIFWASFNAVFHSVVQVFLGKELLVDFVNQYGLYPHFLEPVFRLTGLSVFSFTAVMGLLNCLAFACLYRFLARETGDAPLAFLGLTTLVFFGYAAGRVALPDLYLQYHPLRLLFPALSVLVVRGFARSPTPRAGALLIALAAAGSLWNPDSGIIVLASGFLLLVYDALLRRRPREIPARLLTGFAAAAAVVASFSCLMRLRHGAFPDYTRLFGYSQAFYIYGLNMLPMPRFGLWVPVLSIYAASLLLAVKALVEGEDTPRARLCFYLPVLGLGVFTYYQGRSSLATLLAAGYPAVLLVVLFTGALRRAAPGRSQPAERLLAFTLLSLLAYSVPALATIAPGWARGIAGKIRVTMNHRTHEALRDAEFLQRLVRPGQEIVIVSGNSGLHHLLTRTTSPLDIPGNSEIILRADYHRQSDFVLKRRGTFVIDKNSIDPYLTAHLKRLHPVFHENPHGAFVVFPGP